MIGAIPHTQFGIQLPDQFLEVCVLRICPDALNHYKWDYIF
jgi:hypothetical protein